MRTAKRTGYQRPAKHKQGEKQDDRFLAMVCFQMALCILAAAVFFAACRGEQGESDSAVYKTAQLLCGQQSERLIDWESLRGQDWLQKIKDFWQGGAAELLERKVRETAERFHLTFRRIRISGASGRWGSCSRNGSLNFSWRLILWPEPVVDYVVAHELAHRLELNHSERFWREVERMCPEYRKLDRFLREHVPEFTIW